MRVQQFAPVVQSALKPAVISVKSVSKVLVRSAWPWSSEKELSPCQWSVGSMEMLPLLQLKSGIDPVITCQRDNLDFAAHVSLL